MELEQKVDQIQADVAEIKSALRGYDGQRGLIKQVESNTKNVNKLWITLAIISGATSAGGFAILRTLLGG